MPSNIKISDHFTYGRLLRFTLPTVGTMVLMSLYSMVDGLFVSNLVGTQAFAAMNIAWPFIMLLSMFGLMVGAGGGAIVARQLGEGRPEEANRNFSMLIWCGLVAGAALGVVGFVATPAVCSLMGAQGGLLDQAVAYGRVLAAGIPAVFLQDAFQTFFVTAERPGLGTLSIGIAGATNVVLDALFMAGLGWGIEGAAVATVASEAFGGLFPLCYFLAPNRTRLRLRLRRAKPDWKVVRETCVNGSSELVTNISESIMSMLYNWQLMRYLGENGVAAYGVLMYVGFIFMAIVFGQAAGSAPIESYAYGAKDTRELSNLLRKNVVLMLSLGVVLTVAAQALVSPLASTFVRSNPEVLAMTVDAMGLYKYAFLLMGFNVFASSFFTALGNGPVSALISMLRSLVFEVAAILVLPPLFGAAGIWLSMLAAEVASFVVSLFFLVKLRGRYGYTVKRLPPQA